MVCLLIVQVPYIRIPLVLSFFANDDRIHALRNDDLRELLNASLFEPGRYVPIGAWATSR